MNDIPVDLRNTIYSYIEDEIIKHWKITFSKVVFELNPKEYYSFHIMNELKLYINYMDVNKSRCNCFLPKYQNSGLCWYCCDKNGYLQITDDWNIYYMNQNANLTI